MPEAVFGPGQALPKVAPRTSLRLEAGRPRHPEAHGKRLVEGLRALGHDPTWLDVRLQEAWTWAAEQAAGAPVLSLRLQADPSTHSLHARLEALPSTPEPYTLAPLPHPLSRDRAHPLAPHKGCLGPWNATVLARAQNLGAQDALLHWADGTLVETAIAALGLEMDGRFILPSPTGRVRSLAELLDLPGWADERGWRVAFAPISLEQAASGQLWCFNALRGLWPAQVLRIPA